MVLSGCAASSDQAQTQDTGYGPATKVEIEVQDYGTIKLDLYADVAPVTVANFCKLAKEGFYDGLTFHRVINNFMIQGGDPQGNGLGGSDENIVGEFQVNGHPNPLLHNRGTISMARAKDYNSASSQFFICQKDSHHLDGSYAAFGVVTEGMDVVDTICMTTPVRDSNGTVPRSSQPVITKITVVEETKE
ncbi:MAG: peptidylprolyl isomerase [Lachnospiraceae bacterium]|nr:peptidylprolyl isomerase [Lachnospiraceae bacterium]